MLGDVIGTRRRMRGEELLGRVPVEQRTTGQHLICNPPECIQVGAMIDGVARRLLRRHVRRRA